MASSALTLVAVRASGGQGVRPAVRLENARVRVSEVTYVPGVRAHGIRPTDQVIVFLDDCSYERTTRTPAKTMRERKAGEVIWHDKGEDAPVLTNAGRKPYRTLIIELK